MVREIKMNVVASYKLPVLVSDLKRVNLFYGLNGTGKSTLSQFLSLQGNPTGRFSSCVIEFQPNKPAPELLVYNQDFVDNNFFSTDTQKGIFTLDKANTEAEGKIRGAREEIKRLELLKPAEQAKIVTAETSEKNDRQAMLESVWGEKVTYENTPLRPCLEGYMGKKEAFFAQLQASIPSTIEVEKIAPAIAKLEEEYAELNADQSGEKSLHPILKPNLSTVETASIFNEKIVGSEDSYLSDLIAKLGHEQWVNQGITQYLDHADGCPFCTQQLSADLRGKIKSHIDATYQTKISELSRNLELYRVERDETIVILRQYLASESLSKDMQLLAQIRELQSSLDTNLALIEKKLKAPDEVIVLADTSDLLQVINKAVETENGLVSQFNEKLKNRAKAKAEIKLEFWKLLRAKHTREIEAYGQRLRGYQEQIAEARAELQKIGATETIQNQIILENQQKTKNVEMAINSINQRLKSFGLEGFKIERVKTKDENQFFYKISRDVASDGSPVFKTLSEGEKTLISFLYFIEGCVGVSDIDKGGEASNRIVVIDDPISSLSFNLVYDVATLIKDLFLNKESEYRQIFILTHHLYFLHEFLGVPSHELKKDWALFRVHKSDAGTAISKLKKNEIQNNYEGYWQLVKDAKQGQVSKVALPNAMRNILEQYFSFIHGLEGLKDILKKMAKENAADPYYKSFDRYINRESHSDATNYVDSSEIDTDKYLKFFEKVFVDLGHPSHFKTMMGLDDIEDNVVVLKPTGTS